jgi:hypothetical protein
MAKHWKRHHDVKLNVVKRTLKEWVHGVSGVYMTEELGCFRVVLNKRTGQRAEINFTTHDGMQFKGSHHQGKSTEQRVYVYHWSD